MKLKTQEIIQIRSQFQDRFHDRVMDRIMDQLWHSIIDRSWIWLRCHTEAQLKNRIKTQNMLDK